MDAMAALKACDRYVVGISRRFVLFAKGFGGNLKPEGNRATLPCHDRPPNRFPN